MNRYSFQEKRRERPKPDQLWKQKFGKGDTYLLVNENIDHWMARYMKDDNYNFAEHMCPITTEYLLRHYVRVK